MTPQELLDAARAAADFIVAVLPADVAHQVINDASVRRANAIANAAEAVKFGDTKEE